MDHYAYYTIFRKFSKKKNIFTDLFVCRYTSGSLPIGNHRRFKPSVSSRRKWLSILTHSFTTQLKAWVIINGFLVDDGNSCGVPCKP